LVIEVEDFSSLSVLLSGGHSGGNESIFSGNSVRDIVREISGGEDFKSFVTGSNFRIELST